MPVLKPTSRHSQFRITLHYLLVVYLESQSAVRPRPLLRPSGYIFLLLKVQLVFLRLKYFAEAMSTFIQVPLKKTYEVDVTRPIYSFMMDAYTDLQPRDYTVPVGELNKLRSSFIAKLSDKSEASLDLMYR